MKKEKKTPMRMCVACQTMKPKNGLMRVVADPDEGICLDATGRKGGRGAYLCEEPACVEKALKEHRLERALKNPLPAGMAETLRNRVQKEGNR